MVGNGDHVDEIVAGLDGAASIDTAMSAIEPEPDPPIWTPRIALVAGPGSSKMLSIYQRAGLTERRIVAVPRAPGCAVLQATYSGTVSDPVGDAPYSVWEESRSLAELCNALYQDCLDASLRVLLVAGPAEPSRGGDAVKVSIALGGAARATSH
ncbi:MAG: IMP cyclohydrolase [Actinomycetota bacterium]